jgi:hypothetical protein
LCLTASCTFAGRSQVKYQHTRLCRITIAGREYLFDVVDIHTSKPAEPAVLRCVLDAEPVLSIPLAAAAVWRLANAATLTGLHDTAREDKRDGHPKSVSLHRETTACKQHHAIRLECKRPSVLSPSQASGHGRPLKMPMTSCCCACSL